MSKVLIIGCGGVASVAIHKCCQVPEVFTEICIASRTKAKCDKLAAELAPKTTTKITTAQVDADHVDEVIALIKSYQPDLVMNIALPYQDLTIMDACLACGVNYMDTANYEPENTDDPEWRAIYEKRCKEAGFSAYFDYSWQWAYAKKFEEAGLTALLGNLMGSVCAILIPQRLVAGGMEVSAAISAFGVMFGMSLPLLNLPTAFIAALGLVLVPKLAESAALGRRSEVHRRVSKAMLGTSVLMLPAMAFLVVLGPTLGAVLFRESSVGNYLAPLSVGVVLSCYQSVLSCSLNGVGRQPAAARNALISGAAELVIVFLTVGIPGVGLRGYVWAFLISALVGVVLGAVSLRRATGLRLQIFLWITAPGLAALLMGLCINLLFRVLLDQGCDGLPAALVCLAFGAVLYLSALYAQGLPVSQLFRLRRS